ncbi:hypothetical protein ACXR8U_13875 [Methylobacterium radiotolerans]|jgi:hypothetical protein|uniref:hypothetical protein n=1 Tax=Methylobacterium TaxID=407 RepID=UPI0005E5104F|nr:MULTISPECIES: hypothetical protein [Methylobacterium]MBN6821735.1 hypothetical protein [Methylobacterium organophilum]MCY4498194.1 hypothetical protein [Rhodospirillaceae bacterium]OXE40273.1 hypothetical protein CCS92_19755 [Methylobacterium radiotolerans]GAN49683.1 hypothetical protein ME121_3714 [Methylobacterium sp. ME121]
MPLQMSRRWNYRRLNALQVRDRIAGLGWSVQRFAFVYGVPLQRARDWTSGKEDIPHLVGLVLRLLKLPGARTVAYEYALSVAEPTDKQAAFIADVERRRLAGEFDDQWEAEDAAATGDDS